MGDKSPKATQKQAAQKQVKAVNVKRDKTSAATAAVAATEKNVKK